MEENQDLWDTRLANYSFVFKRKPTWLIAKEESDKLKPLPKKTPKNELTISDVKKINAIDCFKAERFYNAQSIGKISPYIYL